jgi:hypothetical protein
MTCAERFFAASADGTAGPVDIRIKTPTMRLGAPWLQRRQRT